MVIIGIDIDIIRQPIEEKLVFVFFFEPSQPRRLYQEKSPMDFTVGVYRLLVIQYGRGKSRWN